jgi:formylglycine-generating enzyme required for sulfatase activity
MRKAGPKFIKWSPVGIIIVAGCLRGPPAAMPQSAPMVHVPAGDFSMGCKEDVSGTGLGHSCSDAVPGQDLQHIVTLSAFDIDRTEVTQGAYAACVKVGACSPPEANYEPGSRAAYPVTNVTWVQARGYCQWAGKRLPTEAEWEKAARGTDSRRYPWGSSGPSCSLVNYEACGGVLRPAGSLPDGASPYGALDMAGNVEEWVNDWYSTPYYAASPKQDPPGPASNNGSGHVVRGGSFRYDPWHLRTYVRFWDPGRPDADLGFRCARSPS